MGKVEQYCSAQCAAINLTLGEGWKLDLCKTDVAGQTLRNYKTPGHYCIRSGVVIKDMIVKAKAKDLTAKAKVKAKE